MSHTILLLEDEPLILMDLEFAAQDLDCEALTASRVDEALSAISDRMTEITVAVLDVSLGGDSTCLPVAQKLDTLGIPYTLHSGDLDRHEEKIRQLDAELMAKPACADKVIEAALNIAKIDVSQAQKQAAE